MKNLRAWLMLLSLAGALGAGAGCASSERPYTTLNDRTGLAQQAPSPTETMTPVEKTGYYAGWFSLVGLYAWAGSNPTFSPP